MNLSVFFIHCFIFVPLLYAFFFALDPFCDIFLGCEVIVNTSDNDQEMSESQITDPPIAP